MLDEQAASHCAAAADLTEELAHRLWLDDRTTYRFIDGAPKYDRARRVGRARGVRGGRDDLQARLGVLSPGGTAPKSPWLLTAEFSLVSGDVR
jgi:hypothetical protein